jgi:eukaryotic-like serine/threonine-protein kinase
VPCFADDELLDLIEGRRPIDAAVEAHLAGCVECRLVFAAAARDGGTLRDVSAANAPEAEPAWDELGQGVIVGGVYELDAFLGAGAAGVVWAAHRLDDGTRVALKIARTSEPELQRRFEREARIASRLAHPNVVRILDVLGATETRGPCLVEELVGGETLEARFVRDRVLPLRDAARIFVPMARALLAAHGSGIVHRDLKPQNVMLDGARVVVLDFGIAKLLPTWGPHSQLTRPGTVLGSLRYMAPEQVFGERDVDTRADVWALGAMVFRALTGTFPVEAKSIGELTKAFTRGNVASFALRAPGLPDDVRELVTAALVIPRDRRFADVRPFDTVMSRYVT